MNANTMRKLQCVVAAGGLGTRLRPLTNDLPKPMAPVIGIPFLHWLLAKMARFGLQRFLLLTGHCAEKVADYFENGSRWGWEIDYSREESKLGSGGALCGAYAQLDSTFFYVNGDDFPDLDYHEMYRSFVGLPALAMVATAKDPRGKLKLEPSTGKVIDFLPNGGQQFLDCGTKLFRREVLDFICQPPPFDLEPAFWPELIRRGALYAFPIAAAPRNIDTIENLRKLEDWLRQTRALPPSEGS